MDLELMTTPIDAEADLIALARARISADVDRIVSIGLASGVFKMGDQVRPVLDPETGSVMIAVDATKTVYTLAPPTAILGDGPNGLFEFSC